MRLLGERASPVSFGEFLCVSLTLAGGVAVLWLLARPWEEEPWADLAT